MAYNGSVDLISGIRPKNDGEFPLVNAKDVYVDDETRLDDVLETVNDDTEAIENSLTDLSNEIKYIATNNSILCGNEWFHGSYGAPANYDSPNKQISNTRISTEIVFDTPKNIYVDYDDSSDYLYVLSAFDTNNELISSVIWASNSRTVSGVKTLRLSLRKNDNNEISLADRFECGIQFYVVDGLQNFKDVEQKFNEIKMAWYYLESNDFVQGSYGAINDYNSPNANTSNTRIRSEIVFERPINIHINISDVSFKLNFAAFDSNNRLLQSVTNWSTNNRTILDVKTLRIIIAKNDDELIKPSEFEKSSIRITSLDVPDIPIKLTVMSFNLGRFSFGVSPYYLAVDFDEKVLNYRKVFSQYKPDIIGFQEYNKYLDVASGVGNHDTNEEIFGYLYPYYFDSEGNAAIKSKYPLYNKSTLTYNDGTNRIARYAVTQIWNKTILIISTHLYPNSGADRDAIRAQERQELISLMSNYEYVICFGDFNAQSTDDYNDFLNAGYKIANGGYLPFEWTYSFSKNDYDTEPSDLSNVMYFDNIIVTSNILVSNSYKINTYKDLSSDHIPFVAELLLV